MHARVCHSEFMHVDRRSCVHVLCVCMYMCTYLYMCECVCRCVCVWGGRVWCICGVDMGSYVWEGVCGGGCVSLCACVCGCAMYVWLYVCVCLL